MTRLEELDNHINSLWRALDSCLNETFRYKLLLELRELTNERKELLFEKETK